jgi:hypothetical protein
MATRTRSPLEVDGDRVDALVHEIRDTFRTGAEPWDGPFGRMYPHHDTRDWRDMALLTLIERWQVTPGDDDVWDAAASLLDSTGGLGSREMIEKLVVLVSAADRLMGENDRDVPWQMVRKVDAAYEAVGDAIAAWKAEVA